MRITKLVLQREGSRRDPQRGRRQHECKQNEASRFPKPDEQVVKLDIKHRSHLPDSRCEIHGKRRLALTFLLAASMVWYQAPYTSLSLDRRTHFIAGPDGLRLDAKNSEGFVAGIVLSTPEDGNIVVDWDAFGDPEAAMYPKLSSGSFQHSPDLEVIRSSSDGMASGGTSSSGKSVGII